jgi:hypothetical protein
MDKDEAARRERAERLRKRIREGVDQGQRAPTTPRELADEEAEKARREKDASRP